MGGESVSVEINIREALSRLRTRFRSQSGLEDGSSGGRYRPAEYSSLHELKVALHKAEEIPVDEHGGIDWESFEAVRRAVCSTDQRNIPETRWFAEPDFADLIYRHGGEVVTTDYSEINPLTRREIEPAEGYKFVFQAEAFGKMRDLAVKETETGRETTILVWGKRVRTHEGIIFLMSDVGSLRGERTSGVEADATDIDTIKAEQAKRMREKGEDLVGIIHSHPFGEGSKLAGVFSKLVDRADGNGDFESGFYWSIDWENTNGGDIRIIRRQHLVTGVITDDGDMEMPVLGLYTVDHESGVSTPRAGPLEGLKIKGAHRRALGFYLVDELGGDVFFVHAFDPKNTRVDLIGEKQANGAWKNVEGRGCWIRRRGRK